MIGYRAPMRRPPPHVLAWLLAALAYLALAAALTWPMVLRPHAVVPGIPQVDQMDTAWLRLAVARGLLDPASWPHSTEVHAPVGYPVGWLVPNLLDHVTGAPFALALPWPVGDNLWWLLALAGNGLAAHLLGVRLGGSHGAGALCGVLFATCEPVLREANLHHAPQVLLFASPLYVLALWRATTPDGTRGDAVLAGLAFATAALGYWYQGLFLAIASVAPAIAAVWRARDDPGPLRRLALAAGLAAAVGVGPLALYLSAGDGVPDPSEAPPADPGLTRLAAAVPDAHRWTLSQGADPLWPLRPTPLDRSNRLSAALLAAAVLGGLATPRGRRWPWVASAAVAGVLLMGPYLKVGEDPALVAGRPVPLPGLVLAEVSGLYARLSWPQRWGVIVPLMLLPLAARAPRPRVWAAVALIEAFVVSGNAPLHLTPIDNFDGWRSLAAADGAVLVLPLDREGPKGPSLGFIYRASGRPLVTPTQVPPGAAPAAAWEDWRRRSKFAEWLAADRATGRAVPLPPDALDQLRDENIDAIAIDATPGGLLGPDRVRGWRERLERHLGPPIDYGSALVWWLDPPEPAPPGIERGDYWRLRVAERLADAPEVAGPTIVRPVYWR